VTIGSCSCTVAESILTTAKILSWTISQPPASLHSSSTQLLSIRSPRLTWTLPDAVMAIFSINCTLPPHATTFARPPNARGTMDIVYSCLAVIVLCTWSVLHLNVPAQITSAKWHEKPARCMSRTFTKVGWMAFNILAPEWPFSKAVCGRTSECQRRKKFKEYSDHDEVPWSSSHTQLANMGGFVIRFDQRLPRPGQIAEQGEQRGRRKCVVDRYCLRRR
jgi:hypothetical protein